MASPKFDWAVKRNQWKKSDERSALSKASDIDRFLASVEEYRYAEGDVVVDVGIPALTVHEEKYHESHWSAVVQHYGIKADFRLYKNCCEWDTMNPVNPREVFLGTWKIDPEARYHNALLGRVRETMTYGCFKPFQWLALFARIGMRDCIEIRSIAGLIVKSNGMPFKVKKGDNSVVDDLSLFYNIQNIIETQLNIANLRASLNLRVLLLYTSHADEAGGCKFLKHEVHLDSLLDEIALTYGVAPKQTCKAVRSFLTLVIRTAGCLATEQRTFKHGTINKSGKTRTSDVQALDFDARTLLLPFFLTKVMQNEYLTGLATLTSLKMHKLRSAVELYMAVSLVKTDPDHFITFGSFLHSIMALAGYGRALPYASAPVQGEEKTEDVHSVADKIEEQIISLHNQAIEHGFSPPVGEKWIPACVSYWKSTSAGVAPINVELHIDGVPRTVKVRKKAAIGAIMGKSAFTQKVLSARTSLANPSSVGHRDVPYKPTRSIYVVPLPTQYAQIAVASHIVNFISTRGKNGGRYGLPIDPSHCTTGSGSTTGQRIVDTYDTIAASGDPGLLAIGTDLSSYDANLGFWNFRKPFLSALKRINAGNTFGPERIPGAAMVDYAFGEGRIYKSYWDNGRRPIIVVAPACTLQGAATNYTYTLNVGADIPSLKPMPGMRFLPEGTHVGFDIDACIKDRVAVPWDSLRVAVLRDGSDVVFLTSEASGELTTLAANTISNVTMQQIAIRYLHASPLGKYLNIIYMKGVGDDAEWIGTLSNVPPADVIDEVLDGLKKVYAEMGHIFSPSKTYVMPLSAEYIQTFARFGLYIPRDQIMVVPSEKPRTIRNPVGFLDSFKQLLLSKCSRGFNPDYAATLFLWHAREISRLTLRRHALRRARGRVKLGVPGGVSSPIRIQKQDFSRTSRDFKDPKASILHYYHSVITFMLPISAGGLGWNPLSLQITNTPAIFLRFISAYDDTFSCHMYAHLAFTMRLPKNDGQSTKKESGLGRVELPQSMKSIGVEDIFSPSVQHNLFALRGVHLGRANGENVPRRILVQGLELENFMEVESNYEREMYAESFLTQLTLPMKRIRHDGDEWTLAFRYEMEEISCDKMHDLSFYRGIGPENHTLLQLYGMSWDSNRLGRSMERLRLIISRDPAMRGVASPEEVISLLDRFGITDAVDFDIGFVVLARAGFEPAVVHAILETRLNPDNDLAPDSTYGSFSDDFGSSLNLYTSDRLRQFSMPMGLSKAEERSILLYASNRSLFEAFYNDKPIIINGALPIHDGSRDGISRKIVAFPRTHRQMVLGQRSKAKIDNSLRLDLLDIKQ